MILKIKEGEFEFEMPEGFKLMYGKKRNYGIVINEGLKRYAISVWRKDRLVKLIYLKRNEKI